MTSVFPDVFCSWVQFVEMSRAQDIEAGDGTTTVVAIAGALLQAANQLLDRGVHPQAISEAFLKASDYVCASKQVVCRFLRCRNRLSYEKLEVLIFLTFFFPLESLRHKGTRIILGARGATRHVLSY